MTIKKLLLVILTFSLFAFPAYATDYYACTALTGGGTGALDAIDGSGLEAADVALVTTSSATYIYRLDATSGAAESDPTIISPDSNAGTKRWLMVGGYLATIQLPSGTSANEISIDGTFAGNSDDAVPTEKAVKTYVDGQIAAVAAISNFAGYVERPKFEYKDTDEIYLNPGRYEHNGTSQQMVYWDSQLTFQFGPGGSNAGSSALAASDWFHIYIDDSAVVTAGTNLLTATEFIAVTTAPTWSNAKHGLYNGNDRWICSVLTNASSQVLEFWHDGGEDFIYADQITDRALADIDTTPVSVTLTVPDIGENTRAIVSVEGYFVGSSGSIQYIKTGSSATTGQKIASGYQSNNIYSTVYNRSTGQFVLVTDSSQSIDVWSSTNSDTRLGLYTVGYKFPRGA